MSYLPSGLEMSQEDTGRRLTGGMVLVYLLAFFGTIAAVNGTMIYFALSTFRGEEDARPYEHGLAYGKDIAAARAQAALNWHVSAHVGHEGQGTDVVDVTFRDEQNRNVGGLSVGASFEFATDKRRDRQVRLSEVEPGHYRGTFAAQPGLFDLAIDAERDGHSLFRSRNRVSLD
jgi:nitrogen fixation protein FixH